ncbi:MAG: hypothetical protein KIS92_17780 [Planctomycetota bacterium]|nr:hypothetical protein [Planctomycetota bacterium]
MSWLTSLFGGEPPGMKTYYVAWRAKLPETPPQAAFEYVIHPGKGDLGESYFAGLLTAERKEDVRKLVQALFADAVCTTTLPIDDYHRGSYEKTRKGPGVRVIKPLKENKPAPA